MCACVPHSTPAGAGIVGVLYRSSESEPFDAPEVGVPASLLHAASPSANPPSTPNDTIDIERIAIVVLSSRVSAA
jgi:hypothetical protein